MSSLLPEIPNLEEEVASLLRQVPAGRVTTFGRLAMALGETQAARWLAADWSGICARYDLPGHRVVLRDGRLPAFGTLDPQHQASKLRQEGVPVANGQVPLAEAAETLVAELKVPAARPLDGLRMAQERMLKRVQLRAPTRRAKLVAGLDVSYASAKEGVACYALVEVLSGHLIDSVTYRGSVTFPYIPGFLTFREVPLYLELLDKVHQRGLSADVLLVDGNGSLHPWLAGVATHLGVVAGLPTIGVSKSLLCGRVVVEERQQEDFGHVKRPRKTGNSEQAKRERVPMRPVIWQDRVVAQALWTTRGGRSSRPTLRLCRSASDARLVLRARAAVIAWPQTS